MTRGERQSLEAFYRDPSYLLDGNERQRSAHACLAALDLFAVLAAYDPVLAGTVPIAIDTAASDLDILCEVADFDGFAAALLSGFGALPGFRLQPVRLRQGRASLKATFDHGGFPIEIFGQARPVADQHGLRHMLLQARLLALGGDALRRDIAASRAEGLKTEPAFARRLGLKGDPYVELLTLEDLPDEDLEKWLE